ncbi:hypothetical protein BSNK01_04730 [Bacillaceae bacterium]
MNRVDRILNDIRQLSIDELKEFNEKYIDFIEQKGWTLISEKTLDWDDDMDDYSDVQAR